MGANLLDLPDEVLVLIFSDLYVSNARPRNNPLKPRDLSRIHRLTLCNLSLMSRRLNSIVYPLLLEDVKLSMPRSNEASTHASPLQPLRPQANRRITSSVDQMRRFEIIWNGRTPDTWATDLFRTAAAIEDLMYLRAEGFNDSSNSKNDCALIGSMIRNLHALRKLVLNIDGFNITAALFSEICSLPHLDTFQTRSRIYGTFSLRNTISTNDYGVGSHNFDAAATQLTHLSCNGEYLDLELLRNTLSRSPNIQSLHITLPGPGTVPDVGMKPLGGNSTSLPHATYRPTLVAKALLPCALTLQELICVNHEVLVPFNDGSIIDLSPFQSLHTVAISIRLLCKALLHNDLHRSEPGPLPAPKWFSCLPKGLKKLEIHFDYSRGLFWNKSHLESLEGYRCLSRYHDSRARMSKSDKHYMSSMNSDFSRRFFEPRIAQEIREGSRTRWARELIDDRFEHLGSLNSFHILETVKIGRRQRRAWGQLDLASVYPETFGCPDIDLEILVRTPPGYNAPPFTSFR